jgi:enoyl-CoA hydratase/carnithine racemase
VERSGAVVVSVRPNDPLPDADLVTRVTSLPIVIAVVAEGTLAPAWQALADVVVPAGDASLEAIEARLSTQPLASTALALLLRGTARRTVEDGLVAESAVYSVLQSGPEYAAWRASRPGRDAPPADAAARVSLRRDGPTLQVTLTRAHKGNALDAAMRDELVAALAVAQADPLITLVELRGEGASFCTGGDLDEFGTRADPASAHVIRLQRSPARVLSELSQRTVAHVHGACAGSGVELPAFAETVIAHPDATFALPELALGLIPGAGGTVSLPARIGRLRTAWLALSGQAIDADTAVAWGLVDALADDDLT